MGSERKNPIREIRLRLIGCIVVVMLSIDYLNPIKVICSTLGFHRYWFAGFSVLLFVSILAANAGEVSYFVTKVFFHSILSIFFSSVEVLGKQNIPEHGPIIFTGNHMNQFVDAAVMVATNPHQVRFLMAEKSFKTRIVGDLANAIGSIPVARPQDYAKKGAGKIRFDGLKLEGIGTYFTKLKKGDKLRPGRSPNGYKVKKVISDTEAELAEEMGEPSPLEEEHCQLKLLAAATPNAVTSGAATAGGGPKQKPSPSSVTVGKNEDDLFVEYDILEFIDQHKVFDKVHHALSQGSCIGIFPEGGSHDNTDLLPLKVGVAAIAFGVLDKFDVNVPIVPVGLNYFRGHRFRGRVVVEFGQPIYLDKALIQQYRESKREAFNTLLGSVRDGMRSVIVTATDYAELKMIHTLRRLYQRPGTNLTTGDKQDLARRFSVAHRLLLEKQRLATGEARLPDDLVALQKKVEEYQDMLAKWGLKDYQIGHLDEVSFYKTLYQCMHGAFVMSLATFPALILNAPVGFAASYWANKQAKKDLKASRVKVAARDVLLSKKITFSLVAVPTLWITYALLLFAFTKLSKEVIFALFLSCPVFSYIGVMAVEAGMVDVKDLRPAFLRLLPSFQQELTRLPQIRMQLQKEVRQITKKYGKEFGTLYTGQPSAWEKEARDQLAALTQRNSTTDAPAASSSSASSSSSTLLVSSTITSLSNGHAEGDGSVDGLHDQRQHQQWVAASDLEEDAQAAKEGSRMRTGVSGNMLDQLVAGGLSIGEDGDADDLQGEQEAGPYLREDRQDLLPALKKVQ